MPPPPYDFAPGPPFARSITAFLRKIISLFLFCRSTNDFVNRRRYILFLRRYAFLFLRRRRF